MATVIDSLVVELGLDPAKFTKGQSEAISSLRKMEDEAKKRGGQVEKAASGMEQGFASLQKRLLGVAGLLLGGLGIEQFIQKVTKLQVATANMGQVLGVSSQNLQQWFAAAERFGVPGAAAQQGLATIQSQRFALLNGNPNGAPLLNLARATGGTPNPLGINQFMAPEQQAMEIAKWLERSPRKAQDAAALTQLGGLSQDFVAMLMKGSKELEKMLGESRAAAPTDEEIKRFKELNDAFEHASQMAKRLGTALTALIAPNLVTFFEELAKKLEGTSKIIDRIVSGDKVGAQKDAQLQGDVARLSQLDSFIKRLQEKGVSVPEGTMTEQKRLTEEIKRLREELQRHDQQGGFQNQSFGGATNDVSARLIQTAFSGGGAGFGGGLGGVGGGGPGAPGRNPFGGTRSAMGSGGPGEGFPGDDTAGLQGNDVLRAQRAGIKAEIEKNPNLRNELAGMMATEGTPLQSMESLANRLAATKEFLKNKGLPPVSAHQMLHGGFYGPINRGALRGAMAGLQRDPKRMKQMQDSIDAVLNGSNTIQGATDQGMPSDPNGRHVGSDGFRLYKKGNVFNDWGGGGGHQFNERWRRDTQRRVRESAPSAVGDGGGGSGGVPIPKSDPRGAESERWNDSLMKGSRDSMYSAAGSSSSQSYQIGDIHIHQPVGNVEDLASNVRGNVRRFAGVVSANNGPT